MKNIAVIIRTYSRVDDAKALVDIIRNLWTQHNYTLFIAFNGATDGYVLDKSLADSAEIIEVTGNLGHIPGARQLVQQGYEYIKNNNEFDYIIFIESDFWLLDEALILEALASQKSLATTIWGEHTLSLAVDFFIVKKDFLDNHPQLISWPTIPELDMRDELAKIGEEVYIFENFRPISVPSPMRQLLGSFLPETICFGKRFVLFSEAKALSHHVECLKEGIVSKKAIANTLLNRQFFPNIPPHCLSFWDKYARVLARYLASVIVIKRSLKRFFKRHPKS